MISLEPHFRGAGPLPIERREALGAALSDFLVKTQELLERVAWNPPPQGSGARAWRDSQSEISTRTLSKTPVHNAQTSMFTLWSASLDHSRAFAALIEAGTHRTSLATLIRGSAEALGRAYWLLEATSREDLVARHIAASLAEMRGRARRQPEAQLIDQHGVSETVRDWVRELEADLDALGSSSLRAPSYAQAAVRAFNRPHAAKDYSDLSAMAHAESMGFVPFVSRGTLGESYVDLPAPVLVELCGDAFTLQFQFVKEFAARWRVDPDDDERWKLARMAAGLAIQIESHRVLGFRL